MGVTVTVGGGGGGFKHPSLDTKICFSVACLSQMLVRYEDTPTPSLGN